MNDEELLSKYKNYVKKRNMCIIISLLFIFFFIIMSLSFLERKGEKQELPKTEDNINNEETIDEAPVLELTTSSIEIEVNSTINYESYLKSVIDDIDGDLKDKVQYSKIDTSETGEYEILYFVFDSSNNVAQKILKVTIVEPKVEEPVPEDNQEKNSSQSSQTQIQETPSKTDKNNQSSGNNVPSTKYFLFKDGYTMNNVVEACATELKKYKGSGRCEPITDGNGIYLGMKLEFE